MKSTLVVAAAAFALASSSAVAGTVIVNGTSDPFLAGAPSGGYVNFGITPYDTAPADSPVGISVKAGETVDISSVTGGVCNFSPNTCGTGPGGGGLVNSAPFTTNGFTGEVAGFTNLPVNSLIGVFTGPTLAVQSPFEVGSGGTWTVPTGATGFYLATVDSYGWYNNSGAFSVGVTVPEPATWALLLVGFAGLGVALRTRRRTQVA